jgi:hypothetical protein
MNFLKALILSSLIIVGLPEAFAEDLEEFFPIYLTCPADNGGILGSFSENRLGDREHLLVEFDGNTALHVKVGAVNTADDPLEYSYFFDSNLLSETDPDYLNFGLGLVDRDAALKLDVCEGSANARTKYFAELTENPRKLGID